jgi:tetratricopeptide (TPR) repeat protein
MTMMNPIATIAVAILGAAAASFAVIETRSAPPAPPTDGALKEELGKLRAEVAELRRAPSPQTAPASSADRTAVPTLTDEQIAQALERYLTTHADKLAANAALAGASAEGAVDVKGMFASLLKGSRFFDHSDLYKKAFAAGKMDELVGMFEQNAKDNPKDTQAQMDLANSYIAWLQMDPSKGRELGLRTDQQFDKVLALDENHWEARFDKAVSYSFWPKFLGKDKDAIANFERLADQQDSMPVEDSQAQTYLFLGNLLEQRDPAHAREVWQRGLRRHPNNADLQKKVGQ